MPPIPAHVFREYDIRGLVASELTPAFARMLGQAFGTLLFRRLGANGEMGTRRVVVGRDVRESSGPLRDALVEGLLSAGLTVTDVGVVATPLVYFGANTLPVDGFVMITGSHNPPEFNGFKMGIGRSTFFGEDVQALRTLCESGDFMVAAAPGEVAHHDVVADYGHYVRGHLKLGPRRPRVVVDAGNGCGGFIAVPLLKSLGFEVIDQFCEPDGSFPNHHPDPTVMENLLPLIERVRREQADVGIAYDGDADRIGAVNERGEVLWGDQLMILFSRDVLREVPGATVIGEVKCSMSLYEDIEKQGGRPLMWKAGHSLIKAKMSETGAQLAGEMSGHIFFQHRWFGFDDAIYATCRLLEILSHTEAPLSALLADVPQTFASPEIRVDFPDALKFQAVDEVRRAMDAQGLSLIDVDGVRVVFPDGWGLVRASNTQPLLVVRYEAKTEPRLQEIRALVEQTLDQVRHRLGVP